MWALKAGDSDKYENEWEDNATTMIKLYFKQAFHLLKENKLLSSISIIGTALAIAMIMVIVITLRATPQII